MWVDNTWVLIEVLVLKYMITSDVEIKLMMNEHDWWWMEEMYIDCGIID